MSYGERRLVLLARALAARPKLLLLDELLNGLDEINHARAVRWLERTRGLRMPWVLAAHRVEDVPPSATHALVLEKGRIVYSGKLRGAPLERWLNTEHDEATPVVPVKGKRRARAPGFLVRLTKASVYLDEHLALQKISLEVRPGECWVVHGRNGSGKTTLLRTLYGDHGVAVGGRIERAGIEPGVPLEVFKRRVGLVAPHLQADHPQHLDGRRSRAVGPAFEHRPERSRRPRPTGRRRGARWRSLDSVSWRPGRCGNYRTGSCGACSSLAPGCGIPIFFCSMRRSRALMARRVAF